MSNYLVGYKFGIVWEGETETEEYTIVQSNANLVSREVNLDTDFARSIIGKNKGDVCVSKGNKFLIKYIVCPTFSDLCKKRNIQYLYHFTAIDNLDSIMAHGLLSINRLKSSNIFYDFNDTIRLDNHLDYISCSVEFPNGILLNNFKKRFNKKYVLLKINIDVLNYKDVLCSQYNAATYYGNYIQGVTEFYKLYDGERYNLPDSLPTNEQAEILVDGQIEPQYIEQVIFETNEDERLYKDKYNTAVNHRLFQYRDRYIRYSE
jgi:hypothetical protein